MKFGMGQSVCYKTLMSHYFAHVLYVAGSFAGGQLVSIIKAICGKAKVTKV